METVPLTGKQKTVHEIKDDLDLTDIWREINKKCKRFTWRQKSPEIHCRLEFFLVSSCLSSRGRRSEVGGHGFDSR